MKKVLNKKFLAIAMTLGLAFAVLLSVQLAFAAGPYGLTVDSFFESMELVAKGNTPPAIYTYTTVTSGTGILGGQLDVEIENSADDGGSLRQIRATSSSGSFSYAADDTVQGWARLIWDGPDGNATVTNTSGLSGTNVTNGGINTGFHIRLSADHPATLTLFVYTNATNWSKAVFTIANTFNAKQSVFIPFGTGFTTGGGSGATFTSVGAIVLYIDGTNLNSAGLDMSLDFVETNRTDLGDAPNTYGTLVASNGARHILGGNFLGASVDDELDGQPSVGATGDDILVSDDEDGVVRYKNWAAATGYIRVIYTQTITGCLNGWLDYNNITNTFSADGDFGDTFEHIITDQPISRTTDYTVSLPVFSPNNGTFYSRFRVVPDEDNDGDCSATDPHAPQPVIGPTGTANGGEVEDYRWTFGPTAITLSSLSAKSETENTTSLILFTVAILGLGALGFVRIRRRRAQSL